MAQFGEYTIAWLAYLVSVIGLLVVAWRVFRGIPWCYVRRVLWLTVAVLLLTPAIGTELVATDSASSQNYWAPAWLIGSLEALFGGVDTAIPVAQMVGIVLLVVLAVYTVFSVIMLLVRIRKGEKKDHKGKSQKKSGVKNQKIPPRVA